jgi:hypothetical protein
MRGKDKIQTIFNFEKRPETPKNRYKKGFANLESEDLKHKV